MKTIKEAKLIYHEGIDQVYLAVKNEDGSVTLWDAKDVTFKSQHASFDTAINESTRMIDNERFSIFYAKQEKEKFLRESVGRPSINS